jgi:hypothetical protein
MEQQTGGFGPWPSDEAPQLGVVGAAEPIEAVEAADVAGDAGADEDAGANEWDLPDAGDAGEAGDVREPEDAREPAVAFGSAGAGEPGTAWEGKDSAGGTEPGGDAWEVEDSAGGTEPGTAWEGKDSAGGTEPGGDAWEVEDSAGGSGLESVGELPDGPAPDGPAPDGPAPDPGPRAKTGEPRVDAALARLDELAGRPVTEHRSVFEDVHRRLRDVLGELDTREPPEPPNATRSESRAGR